MRTVFFTLTPLFLTLFLGLPFSGCQHTPSSSELEEQAQKAYSALQTLKERAGKEGSELPEKVSSLFAIEYKVIEVDPRQSPSELEAVLVHLGKERWDCFPTPSAPSERASSFRFICKRYPLNYLKALSFSVDMFR